MTADQAVSRSERISIMEVCGNVSPQEAQKYCDQHPETYGIRDFTEVQTDLIANTFKVL